MTKNTPDFETDDSEDGPTRDLDVYHEAITPGSIDDPFLRRNNLGLGNYDEKEIWRQLERYADGMFGAAAFREKLLRKAIRQTKRRLALDGKTFYDTHNLDTVSADGWRDLDENEQAERSRREYIRQKGEDIWGRMNDADRIEALEIVAGIDEEWTPPHLRVLLAQHEMGRSKGAHTQDNLFGRKSEEKIISEGADEASRLLGGSRRQSR